MHSRSKSIAEYYLQLLLEKGVEAGLLSLDEMPSTILDTILYRNPRQRDDAWESIQKRVHAARKFIFVIPEYNGSFPGILKVWIDALEYPGSLRGKKACMMGLSDGTQGSALAMSHFADVLNYAGVHTLAFRPRFIHIGKNISDGALHNPDYIKEIKIQIEHFLEF
jgi:NAD(P)H-dependent FMN reductase